MGIETFLSVFFWMYLLVILVHAINLCKDHPRKKSTNVGEDALALILSIAFFTWVCFFEVWWIIMQRIRRGKLVDIPDEWVGNITTKRTIRQRKHLAMEKVFARNKRLKDECKFDMDNQ